MRRAVWLTLALLAAAASPARAERLVERSPAVRATLTVRADFGRSATEVRVRGRARVRGRRVALVLVRCSTARCLRPGRRERAVRRLRRGPRRVRATLRVGRARHAQLELWAGRRVLARVRLRAPTAGSAPAPAPVAPAAPLGGVSTEPPLVPAYDPAILDYTIACEPRGSVQVNTSGVTRTVPLRAGQSLALGDGRAARCLPRQWTGWTVTRDGPAESDWIVFNTAAGDVGYTVIADRHGVPVWWLAGEAPLMDGRLLPDGTVAVGRHLDTAFGRYPYSRFALDGTPLGTLDTVGFAVDQHDLEVLPNGNVLLMAYVPREHVDLTAIGGPADATVADALLQEVTPDRHVVWSWRSSDHVGTGETTFPIGAIDVADGDRTVYDLVHLNSLQSDGDGVIVSARHLDAVLRIRRADGGIDWKLGGTPRAESLDFQAGAFGPPGFGGQHQARRLADGSLTVHDNGMLQGRPPRALRLAIDPLARTARVVERVTDARATDSFCCGSATRLPGGHWLMSWGASPVITELTGAGEPVLTLRLAQGFSYRAYPVPAAQLSRAALRAGMDAMAPR